MPTQHVHNLLPDYVNARLERSLQHEVDIHLQACAECRAEAKLIADVFLVVHAHKHIPAPKNYFSALVPRLRQRVERREHWSAWFSHPLFIRFAAPLAAAVVLISLVMQMPFSSDGVSGRFLTDNLSFDDVADAFAYQDESNAFIGSDVETLAASSLTEGILNRQIAELVFASDEVLWLEAYPNTSTDLLLNSLTEQEMETLLKRLEERAL